MAGWGLCGVFGAALAIPRWQIGRFTLAAACGLAGIAYGGLLNFSLMATYGGELSVQRFTALESRAIPFDLAHAVGNVVFALIAGPAMLRMLVRFRERFEWRARTPAVVGTVLVRRPSARGRSPGSGEGGDRRRRGRRMAGLGPEQRRRLGQQRRQRLEPVDNRLGDARASSPPGATHSTSPGAARRRSTTCARRSAKSKAAATTPARSSPSRGPGSTRTPSPGGTSSAPWSSAAAPTAPGKGGPGRPPTRCSPCAQPATPEASKSPCRGWPRSRTAMGAGATKPASRAPPTTPAR